MERDYRRDRHSLVHDTADDVAPGRGQRSSQLGAPERPITSALIRRKARDANGVADGAAAAVAGASSSSGHVLPALLQRKFEDSLGADLSGVRLHTGAESQAAADAVGAKAYTLGSDIHFGADYYDPGSSAGEHLLAHEVAHTVQQTGGVQFKLEVSAPGDAFEVEADRAADAMVSGAPATLSNANGLSRKIQREPAPKKEAEGPEPDEVLELLGHALSKLNDDAQTKAALNAWYAREPKIFQEMWDHPGQGAVVRFVFHKPSEETESMEESYGSTIKSGMEFSALTYDLTSTAGNSVDAGPQAGWEMSVVTLRLVPVRSAEQPASKDAKEHVTVSSAAEFYAQAKAPDPDLLKNMAAKPIDRDHEAVRILDALLAATKAPYKEGVGYMVFVNSKGLFLQPSLHDQITVSHGLKLQARANAIAKTLDARIAVAQKQFDDKKGFDIVSHPIDLDPHALDLARQFLAEGRAAAAALAIDRAFDRLGGSSTLVDLAEGQLYHYDTGKPPPIAGTLKSEDD